MKQPFIIPCGHLDFSVREDTLTGAPAFLHGLSLLFFSDTHVTPETTEADILAFIDRVNALRPDLVCIGGDIADTARDAMRFIRHLNRLRVPLGCCAVPGNNDLEAFGGWTRCGYTMRRAGVRFLFDTCAAIPLEGGCLALGGAGRNSNTLPDYRRIFRNAPEGSYRVLLDHFPIRPECRTDLMLCGHTHGGQFRLLGLTPYSIGFERRAHMMAVSGLHRKNGMLLLVSRGIGASRLPFRMGVPPEINLLRFES